MNRFAYLEFSVDFVNLVSKIFLGLCSVLANDYILFEIRVPSPFPPPHQKARSKLGNLIFCIKSLKIISIVMSANNFLAKRNRIVRRGLFTNKKCLINLCSRQIERCLHGRSLCNYTIWYRVKSVLFKVFFNSKCFGPKLRFMGQTVECCVIIEFFFGASFLKQ